MPEMNQNTFAGRAPPGPAGGAYTVCASPDLLAAMGGYFYGEVESCREGEGRTFKGDGRKERERK